MSPPTERTGPPVTSGQPGSQHSIGDDASATVPQPGDSPAHRRLHWHHVFVIRRRISAELDELISPSLEIDSPSSLEIDSDWFGDDYWADSHMTLGWFERERVGATLAVAGWRP